MDSYTRFWLDRVLDYAYFDDKVTKFNSVIAPYIDQCVKLGELETHDDGQSYVLTEVGRESCLRRFHKDIDRQNAKPDKPSIRIVID